MRQPEINDSFIKELYIKDHELEFLMEDGGRSYYSCQDCDSSRSIQLHALPQEDGGFLCEGDLGEQPVKRGVNTFSIRITKAGETVREYMISVVVKASPADISLKMILVNDEEALIQEGKDYYYYEVDESCAQAEVEAIPSDPKAVIEGDSGLIDLETGLNFFLIRIYSADHSNKASYQLAIERKGEQEEDRTENDIWRAEADDISELSVEDIPVSCIPLQTGTEPVLQLVGIGDDTAIQGQELLEDESLEDIDKEEDYRNGLSFNGLTDIPEEDGSVSSQKWEGPEYEEEWMVAQEQQYGFRESDGNPEDVFEDMSYVPEYHRGEGGPGDVQIDDGSVYGGAGDRPEDSSESRLSDLKVEGCRLKPDFSPDIFDYKVDFQGELDDILVEAVPMDQDSLLEGDLGIQVVITGYNAFSVLCTAPDGISKSLYKYSVEKKKAVETNAGKESSSELKGKKREYKRQVWNARLLKTQSFLKSKTQKKSTMSQSKKLTAVLFLLLCANYPIYLYYTKPVIQNRTVLQTEAAQVSERRSSVEERLSNKGKTVKSIEGYKDRLQEIGDKYPYFPSQEEILYYLEGLQKEGAFTYTAAFIGEPVDVQVSDILNDIAAKNIGTVMGDLNLLTPPDSALSPQAGAAAIPEDAGNVQAAAAQAVPVGRFRKNILTVTLEGSRDNVLRAYEHFVKDQRLIVTDEIQFSQDHEKTSETDTAPAADEVWSLSFNAYYYQYTGLSERSYRE